MGDTILNGINYSKLYSKLDSTTSVWSFVLAIWDSSNKSFFYSGNAEKLLYDFGANKGDTIKMLGFFFNYPMIVDSVDFVTVGGVLKKRLLFEFPGSPPAIGWFDSWLWWNNVMLLERRHLIIHRYCDKHLLLHYRYRGHT